MIRVYKIASICDNCGKEDVRDSNYDSISVIHKGYAKISVILDARQMCRRVKSEYLLCQDCLRSLKIVLPSETVGKSDQWAPSIENRLLDIFRELVEQADRK